MVSSFLSVNYELPKDHASRQHTVPQSSLPSTAATGSSLGSAGPMFADDRVDSSAPARVPRDRFRHGCVAPYSGVVCWLCSDRREIGRARGRRRAGAGGQCVLPSRAHQQVARMATPHNPTHRHNPAPPRSTPRRGTRRTVMAESAATSLEKGGVYGPARHHSTRIE